MSMGLNFSWRISACIASRTSAVASLQTSISF